MITAVALSGAAAAKPDAAKPDLAAACRRAPDASECLLAALQTDNPALRYDLAILRAAAHPEAAIDLPPASSELDEAARAVAGAIIAERRGASAEAVERPIRELDAKHQPIVWYLLCAQAASPAMPGANEEYRTWAMAKRPGRTLTAIAARHVEEDRDKLAEQFGGGGEKGSLLVVAGCRLAMGDEAGFDRAATEAGAPARIRLFVLTTVGRLDRALSYAAGLKIADMGLEPGEAAYAFHFLQAERRRLMFAAMARGRPDIAMGAAEQILTAAAAPDRPENRVMQSGVPQALGYLYRAGELKKLEAWTTRLDPLVREGQRGWSYEDAVAVHRAWTLLGRKAEAAAYREAMPKPEPDAPDFVRASMLATEGRWGEARALDGDLKGAYFDALAFGDAEGRLDAWLAAAAPNGRRAGLWLCASGSDPYGLIDMNDAPYFFPVSLDVSARCARLLDAMPYEADRPFAAAKPLLVVAVQALRGGRPEVAAEMLRRQMAHPLVLAELDPRDRLLLIEAVEGDLHARGKL